MYVMVVFPVNMCAHLLNIWNIKHRERNMNLHCTLRKHMHALTHKHTHMYEVLPKISENFNIPRKSLALRTCAARCLFFYLATNGLETGIFISACVSEFWLFSLHHFHECLQISKW